MSRPIRLFIHVLTLALLAGIAWMLWDNGVPGLFRISPAVSTPLDPAFIRLSPIEIAQLPTAVRFDPPLGSENAALTYNAQSFRISRHLGDDLNGIGGGNSDLGDPVHAAGLGRVVYIGEPGKGWGKMIILAHRVQDLANMQKERVVQTIYAHLETIAVQTDEIVQRGQRIGTVGTGGGIYLAHLHFEVREGPYINPGMGYADTPLNRLSPEKFLNERRGAPASQFNPPPPLGKLRK